MKGLPDDVYVAFISSSSRGRGVYVGTWEEVCVVAKKWADAGEEPTIRKMRAASA